MGKKRVIILGATGSIGSSTVSLLSSLKDDFQVAAVSAHANEEKLLSIMDQFGTAHAALTGKEPQSERISFSGRKGLIRMLHEVKADIVVHGIPGTEGLVYSIEALKAGMDIALANKETAVLGGDLFFSFAEKQGCLIIPTDSEHNAVFQLLRNQPAEHVRKIILTASGGPFRDYSTAQLEHVSLKDALKHPTWSMGRKISIDSATLANKGLEVIETERFFSYGADAIEVLVHPQSIVHSMIQTLDNSIYAQIGRIDMRIPIMNALCYPALGKPIYNDFDLSDHTLTFQKPDADRFPMLRLAYDVLRAGGSYAVVYNTVNDFAVEQFIRESLPFHRIAVLVEKILYKDWSTSPSSFEDIFMIQEQAAALAQEEMHS